MILYYPMSDRINATVQLETRRPIKEKGLIGEYLYRIPQRLEEVHSSNPDCFLFKGHEGEKDGPVCIMDTTSLELTNDETGNKEAFTGMKTTYQKFLPENGRYFYIPTTKGIQNNPQFIRDVVDEAHIVCFQGGEDPSIPFNTPEKYLASKDDAKNQPNPVRDSINYVMLDQALKHGHEQFFIGICRGTQLMMEENLQYAPEGHRPTEGNKIEEKNDIKKTVMQRGNDGEKVEEFDLGDNPAVGCNHHLAAADLPKRLREAGWRIAYVTSNSNDKKLKTIEMAVRRDKEGLITGVMFQNHPEKSNSAEKEKGVTDTDLQETAEKIYAGIREAIKVHQKRYRY